MKTHFYLSILFCHLLLFVTANPLDTISTQSKVDEVTVFFTGAEITRKVSTTLKNGRQILEIKDLPLELVAQSIQVGKIDNAKILSVKMRTNYPGNNDPEVEKREDNIKQIINDLHLKSKEIKVLKQEEKLLMDNRMLSKKNQGAFVGSIKEAADFYRQRLMDINIRQLTLANEIDDLKEDIEDQYKEINMLNKGKKSSKSILVTLDSKSTGLSAFSLTYYVVSASWEPYYDFRVAGTNKPMEIDYNARVFQSTGEDWKDVSISLSTTDPEKKGDKPTLEAWYLQRNNAKTSYQQQNMSGFGAIQGRVVENTGEGIPFANVILKDRQNNQIGGTTTDFDGNFMIKPVNQGSFTIFVNYIGYKQQQLNVNVKKDQITTLNVVMNQQKVTLDEVTVTEYKVPLISLDETSTGTTITKQEIRNLPTRNVQSIASRNKYYVDGMRISNPAPRVKTEDLISNTVKSSTQLMYKIDEKFTVLSDGRDHQLKIKTAEVAVEFKHYAVPKIDSDVFLMAEVTNWTELNLLDGEANVYYEGTYTGTSKLDASIAMDTMELSLGRDRNIIIERTIDKEKMEKRILSSNIKETIAWDIKVRNNKQVPVHLIIQDHFPISEHKAVTVELLESKGASLNEKKSILEWDFNMIPNETESLSYTYEIKYPRGTGFEAN